MSIQQFITTAQPIWRSKPAIEKLLAKVMLGLAVIAAGNSGYDRAVSAGSQDQVATKDRPHQARADGVRTYAPCALA